MKVEPIVVDTNVLLSFVIRPHGFIGEVVSWLLDNRQLIFCTETFDELKTRLWRPKFDRYVTIEERKLFLNDYAMNAGWVEITNELKFSRDPDDNKFIETALVAFAPVLISGDSDLLDVRLENLEILTPRQFAEKYIDAVQYRIHETSGEYTVKESAV